MSKNSEIMIIALLQIMIIVFSFTGGYLFHDRTNNSNEFPILSQAYAILANHGLKDFQNKRAAEYGMIRGMLQEYNDPYTTFLDPPQNELQTNQLEGKYGGVGARIEKSESGNFFLYPFVDSPSARAGVKEGDQLIAVDEQVIANDDNVDDVLAFIRGPINTKVKLTIARSAETQLSMVIEVIREEIILPSVTWNLIPENHAVGYIKINIIATTTPDELDKAISDLNHRGTKYYILDLRNNGGGYVDAGVDIARLFLEDGLIIQQKTQNSAPKSFKVEKSGKYDDIPLAILINNGTASAAEIIAGSLKAHKRAVLIGEQSFGKDSIQLVFTLEDQSSLHVTSAQWWIPGLEGFSSKVGLLPDISLSKENANSNFAIQSAVNYLIQ